VGLIHLASEGHTARVISLLEQKANVNKPDYDKRTALHVACSSTVASLETVKALISAKAQVNSVDKFGATPLDEAVVHQRENEIVKILKDNGGRFSQMSKLESLLMTACVENKVATISYLLDAGVNVNCFDYDRRTPLHIAVDRRNVEVCRVLLDNKADGRMIDRFGLSPFSSAMEHQSRNLDDPIKQLFREYKCPDGKMYVDASEVHGISDVVKVFAPMELLLIVLIFIFGSYHVEGETDLSAPGVYEGFYKLSYTYGMFMDVHVMIFVGFGFLMTFLRKYSFGAVGLTFLLGAYCIQLHIVLEGLFHFIAGHEAIMHIDIKAFVLGDFAAGAVMITYGVLIGKVTSMQMMMIATLEMVFYTANEIISLDMAITDIGGSMVIHMFGAFFGLTLSLVLKDTWPKAFTAGDNASVYHSDTFAMIGTVFLWMYWPSFNAILGVDDEKRHLAITNTVLSLTGSCIVAFLASSYFRHGGTFCMVDVQNATLAGGVAMGSSADVNMHPGTAICIGALAGFVSVFGYTKVQPYLANQWGLHDTCGVNNLHGMPSLIGAITVIIALASKPDSEEHENFPINKQGAFLVCTLVFAIIGGGITGLIVRGVTGPNTSQYYQDAVDWEVPHEERPYFFDKRGELNREENPMAATLKEMQQLATRIQSLEAEARAAN